MKIKCFYCDGELRFSWIRIINEEIYHINYSKYLLSLVTWTSKEETTFILSNIKKVRGKEVKVLEDWKQFLELPQVPDTNCEFEIERI